MIDKSAFHSQSYGMYVIGTHAQTAISAAW